MNIYSRKRLKVAPRHFPRFPLGQKRREHVQEALVKETVLNNEVEGSEQRASSLLEEMSVLPPLFELSYILIFWIGDTSLDTIHDHCSLVRNISHSRGKNREAIPKRGQTRSSICPRFGMASYIELPIRLSASYYSLSIAPNKLSVAIWTSVNPSTCEMFMPS
jgi:hypothetical protein